MPSSSPDRKKSYVTPSASRRGPKRRVAPSKYKPSFARKLVYEQQYQKTRSGLERKDLMRNAQGKVVSRKKYQQGKALQKKYSWRDQPDFIANIRGGSRKSRKSRK